MKCIESAAMSGGEGQALRDALPRQEQRIPPSEPPVFSELIQHGALDYIDETVIPAGLKQQYGAFLDTFCGGTLDETLGFQPKEDDLVTVLREGFEREVNFYHLVVGGIAELARRAPGRDIVVLPDVDHTIALQVEEEGGSVVVPRPAFAMALREAQASHAEWISVGGLTTHAQRELDEQARQTFLAPVQDMVDPTFLFSSRRGNYRFLEELADSDDTAAQMEAMGDLVDPALAFSDPDLYGYNEKVAILNYVSKQYPEKSFLYIEDYPTVNMIRTDHPQVLGLHADANSRCVLSDDYLY